MTKNHRIHTESLIKWVQEKYIHLINAPATKNHDTKNIAIIGGGMLAIHLANHLNKKHKAIIVTRNQDKTLKLAQKQNINLQNTYILEHNICDDLFEILNNLNVNVIIHTAAEISAYKTLNQLQDNIKISHTIKELATRLGAEVYYISSLSIFVSSSLGLNTPYNCFEIKLPECEIYGGYAQSKYINEYIFQNDYIIRPGLLTPSYTNPIRQENFLQHFIDWHLKSGFWVDLYRNSQTIPQVDITPIDIAAEIITDIVNTPNKQNNIFHIANPKHLDLISLMHLLTTKHQEFTELDHNYKNMVQFTNLINKSRTQDRLITQSAWIKPNNDFFNVNIFQSTNYHFDMTNTIKINTLNKFSNFDFGYWI